MNKGLTQTDFWVGVDANPKFLHLAIRPTDEEYLSGDEPKIVRLGQQILTNQAIVEALREKLSYYKKYSGNSLGLGDRMKDYMIETCEEILYTTLYSKGISQS